MGQAQLDLPDPQDVMGYDAGAGLSTDAGDPAASGGADELLAQLAGDEIDRLLAESAIEEDASDEAPAVLAPAARSVPTRKTPESNTAKQRHDVSRSETPQASPAPATQPDPGSVPSVAKASAPPGPPLVPARPPAEPDASLAANLDELLAELNGGKPAVGRAAPVDAPKAKEPATKAAPVPARSATPIPAKTPPTEPVAQAAIGAGQADVPLSAEAVGLLPPLAAGALLGAGRTGEPDSLMAEPEGLIAEPAMHPVEAEMAEDEHRALLAGAIPIRADDGLHHAAPAGPEEDGPLPWYVRLLEVLNAPFAAMPDAMLEVIGKVAIITAVNAIAVLAYVFFFRR